MGLIAFSLGADLHGIKSTSSRVAAPYLVAVFYAASVDLNSLPGFWSELRPFTSPSVNDNFRASPWTVGDRRGMTLTSPLAMEAGQQVKQYSG